ncbi:MAG TPA: YceI family protein [Caulobacteraceae bacterium]|jgi:polyisoprenoid-binding protein YceI
MKQLLLAVAALSLIAAPAHVAAQTAKAAPPPAAYAPTPPPAGAYAMDKAHGSLIFRVNHLGLSHYTARFSRFDAQLQFDPDHPSAQSVTATVDTHSIQTDFPLPTPDFDAQLQSGPWLNAGQFPQMTYRSTGIEMTGARSARINGELTLRGVTHPVILDATFNGGYGANPYDPMGSRIGFSAHGALKRSDYGMSFGIPAPGTNFGVGDEVEVIIEAEFTRPGAKPAAPGSGR